MKIIIISEVQNKLLFVVVVFGGGGGNKSPKQWQFISPINNCVIQGVKIA